MKRKIRDVILEVKRHTYSVPKMPTIFKFSNKLFELRPVWGRSIMLPNRAEFEPPFGSNVRFEQIKAFFMIS